MTLKGKVVVVYLRDPRQRFWGLLRALDSSGAVVEGVDADGSASWARDIAREGEEAPPASVVFFPSSRIEKILLDRSSRSVPALEDHFRSITGRSLLSYLDRARPVRPVPFRRR